MVRFSITLLVLTVWLGAAAAAPLSKSDREQFELRLSLLKQQTVEQVKKLSATVETLTADKQEAVQLQISELKQAAEVERLQILLEWAQTEGDQARIAEIEQALTQLLTPESTAVRPELPAQKSLAPGSEQPNSSVR